MRKELKQLKESIFNQAAHDIALIEQEQDSLIIEYGKIVGTCDCEGKGGYGDRYGERCHCDGQGRMCIDVEYDPCGRNNYSYAPCTNLKPIPKIFKDYGADI